jgi:hypothetical protein
MRYKTIRQRNKKRKRLAKAIKDVRSIKSQLSPKKYEESIKSLLYVARNFPKLRII